jgi:hypothetical protein
LARQLQHLLLFRLPVIWQLPLLLLLLLLPQILQILQTLPMRAGLLQPLLGVVTRLLQPLPGGRYCWCVALVAATVTWGCCYQPGACD